MDDHIIRDAYMRGFNAGYEECLQQIRQGQHYGHRGSSSSAPGSAGETKTGNRSGRVMSPEVRARISESMKKRHQTRKSKQTTQ